ncbi:MAG: hypothetical protein AB2L14_20965 [Candidatus Xenobiia bacterium LiM19]
MVFFSGSSNSRFFVVQRDKEVSLYREELLLWRKELPFGRFKILGVGNNGCLAVLCEDGIYLYPSSVEAQPEFIHRYSREVLKKSSSFLGQIEFHEDGDRFCIESVQPKRSGVESLLKAEKTTTDVHRINILELQTRRHRNFFTLSLSRELQKSFFWNISKNFDYFVIAEPRQVSSQFNYRFVLINVTREEIYNEFELKGVIVRNILVNDDGTILIDIADRDGKILQIHTLDNTKYTITSSRDYKVIHLGKHFIAQKTSPIPSLLVKSFEDNLLVQADLKALDQLGVCHEILFNKRDHIDFLYTAGTELKVIKTEVDLFISEAKRWELIANQQREFPKAQMEKVYVEEKKRRHGDEMRRAKQDELSGQLRKYVGDKKSRRNEQNAEVQSELEKLRLQYILGSIEEDEYQAQKTALEETLANNDEEESMDDDRASLRSPKTQILTIEKAREPVTEISEPQILSSGSQELIRVEKLLAALEERLILGQISEGSYLELKKKYERKLRELR